MRNSDQWFQPGDKVMRVGSECRRDHAIPAPPSGWPEWGQVYCVEDFWEGPQFNVVMLVGFGGWVVINGMNVGWRAVNFRKVEEIKLCVAAVNRAPVQQGATA